MPRSADAWSPRGRIRRWIFRREIVPFLPVLLWLGFAFGGDMVLVVSAILFPAVFAMVSPGGEKAEPRDSITGLPMRRALVEAIDTVLDAAPRSGRTTIVFAIGVDDFSAVEERIGAKACEELLRRLGERIAVVLRGTDIVARIEMGVFGAAFSPTRRADLETAIQTAARLQAAAREPVAIDGARVHVTCSVGFCLGTRAPRPEGEAALAAALEALAEARAAGPASVRGFSPRQQRETAGKRAGNEAEVLEALDQGRIRPWFQPQVSTDTGAVSGFEALARWEHPTRGVLTPKDFLPALTAAGQLGRLGEAILFHSLTALRAWDHAGVRVPSVAVNFSSDELRDPRLADRLAWEFDRFDLTPDRLCVEILETVVADASDDSISRSIATLSRLGCRIDLDDFGTGNASLNALRRFAVGRIKIDRSFVINVDEDRDQQKMIAAILSLAERLGVETLAEGVERVGEHAMLAQLGCGHVQGFGIARPMPFDDTVAWMKHHAEKLKAAPELTRRAV